jgi:hypothetical protein
VWWSGRAGSGRVGPDWIDPVLFKIMNVELGRRQGTQVAHSLSMIAELPHYVDDEAFPVGLRVAAIDAFLCTCG